MNSKKFQDGEWSSSEIAILRREYDKKMPLEEMAERHSRPKFEICDKLRSLGLTPRVTSPYPENYAFDEGYEGGPVLSDGSPSGWFGDGEPDDFGERLDDYEPDS